MSFTPLSPAIAAENLAHIRWVATDMDGTLTVAEQFQPTLLQALQKLATAGIRVLIVTGRSAGWVSGLAHYLPIWGAIAENGGIFYRRTHPDGQWLVPVADLAAHRRQLAALFQQLQTQFPQLRESSDNRFRLTDWTFDVAGLSPTTLAMLATQCAAAVWGFTYSTVQCHIKLPAQSKAAAVRQVVAAWEPGALVTVGDSPNDASLFDPAVFPLSVGVANVQTYRDRLPHVPAFVTHGTEGAGFCELADVILGARSGPPK